MEKYTITKTKKIVLSALMLAIFIILDRFVAINIQTLAITFSGLAIMMVGIYCGPKYSCLIAALGDVIAALLFPFGSYFVGFTISNAIMGLIYGLILHKKNDKSEKYFTLKAIISNFLVLIIVNMGMNTFFIHYMYGKAFWVLFASRGIAQIIIMVINTILIIILEKGLRPAAKKWLYESEEVEMNIEMYLEKLDKFTKDPNLDVMKFVMSNYDLNQCKFIHVAGTNGKGSICEMTSKILVDAGYKVGKFISPHLIKFNDGIYINNKEISNEEVEEILKELSVKIDEFNKTHEVNAKWFEVITCLALIYFIKNKCDFVVLETGLGGITDCTNIVDSMISVIANIGYDHVDILGDTLEKITTQKAGIIKENSNTVFVGQTEEVNKIIIDTCREKNTKLHLIEKDDIKNYSFDGNVQKFDYKKHKEIEINLKGKVQTYNASEVLEIVDILKENGYGIKEEIIKGALKKVVHKARMEVVCNNPLILFDGAHNESAINVFKENVEQYYKENKKIYIVSILKTKDYKTVVKKLCEDKDSIFIFTDGNDKTKYVAKEELYEIAYDYVPFSRLFTMSLDEALNVATKLYDDRFILIVGSFYVYKNVVNYLEGRKNDKT